MTVHGAATDRAGPGRVETDGQPGKLGIVAGGGDLPALLAAACRETGRPVHLLALEGHADIDRIGQPDDRVRPGALATGIRIMRQAGVREVVFAGHVRRPGWRELRPDFLAARLLAGGMLAGGDDRLLTTLVRYLEEKEGFRVVAAETLLADLQAPAGLMTRHRPDAAAEADIDCGIAAARALGRLDIGQAVIVAAGRVIGVEAAEGTDALIARCGQLGAAGGVLVKLPKPGQERRVDLPGIGRATVAAVQAAGLAGIAVEAGGALMLNRDAMIRDADQAGLFILGVAPPRDPGRD